MKQFLYLSLKFTNLANLVPISRTFAKMVHILPTSKLNHFIISLSSKHLEKLIFAAYKLINSLFCL